MRTESIVPQWRVQAVFPGRNSQAWGGRAPAPSGWPNRRGPTPDGEISVRLPRPLEHLANAPRGRYNLAGRAVFAHRGDEWVQRITGANSVSYTITPTPGPGRPVSDRGVGGAVGAVLGRP